MILHQWSQINAYNFVKSTNLKIIRHTGLSILVLMQLKGWSSSPMVILNQVLLTQFCKFMFCYSEKIYIHTYIHISSSFTNIISK